MPTQAQNNAAWIVPAQGRFPGGEAVTLELLAPPQQGTPGLRKPYQFEIPAAKAKLLVAELKAWEKTLRRENKVQCALSQAKPVTYGVRVSLWALACEPGYIERPLGVTRAEWKAITSEAIAIVEKYLGPVVPYIEPWEPKTKFEVRWEGYVKFSEL